MENIPVEWAPVIAKAWLDNEFSAKLKYNPVLAFEDFGLTYKGPVPFTVPARPQGMDMSNLRNDNSETGGCIGECTFSVKFNEDNVITGPWDKQEQGRKYRLYNFSKKVPKPNH